MVTDPVFVVTYQLLIRFAFHLIQFGERQFMSTTTNLSFAQDAIFVINPWAIIESVDGLNRNFLSLGA